MIEKQGQHKPDTSVQNKSESINRMLDVKKIREDFPVLSRKVYGKPLVYLDNAATSQKPRCVIEALSRYYEQYNANVHRGVHALSMEATNHYEEARRKVARFIGAPSPESVIWTRNTTEAINLVASTWARDNISEGDEVVVSILEHHSNLIPWQRLTKEKQAKLRFIPLTREGMPNMEIAESLINERTRLVSVSHVSNSLGTIVPVKQLAKKAHAAGAAILVDGAQSVPHMPVSVQDLDCDFLAFSGHKMLGPTGIGALYVRPSILENMEPFLVGGEMVHEVWEDEATWAELPMRFEAGTPNIADAIALGSAVDYLNMIGMDNVREHEKQITSYALRAFEKIDSLDIFGPRDIEVRGGILPFHTNAIHAHDLGTFLDRQGIAIRTGHHCTQPLMRLLCVNATARASFYLYNTEEEIDMLVDAVKNALKYFGASA